MTTEPYAYTDPDGADLQVSLCAPGTLHMVASEPGYQSVAVCIPGEDVRKVTAAMHEKAGLPDRWAALKDIIFCLRPDGMSGEAYRRYVVESMGRLEAGQ